MFFYRNLRIRNKLIVTFIGLSLLFGLSQLLAYDRFQTLQRAERQLYGEQFALLTGIKDLRIDINVSRARTLALILSGNTVGSADRQEIQGQVQRQAAYFEQLLPQAGERPRIAGLAQSLYQIWSDFAATLTQQVLPALEQGQHDLAQEVTLGIQQQRIDRIRDLGEEIVKIERGELDRQLLALQNEVHRQRTESLAFLALLLALLGLLVWFTSRSIALPLEQLTQWAHRIADGDLSGNREFERRRDEVGLLSEAFIAMSAYLRELADNSERIAEGDLRRMPTPRSEQDLLGNAFVRMVERLRNLTREIQEGADVLAVAGQEILTTTAQVASAAQETAAAIGEITTTVEEVRQTATNASEKARHVSDSAQRTLQVSKDGRSSIESTMAGTQQIREQMQSVAESIVRLSEQAQAIGDVVALVNDLAEQSNLLGVNASIEAMKAGEPGKGFSVVAQEIKNLAVQSKEATTQVRTILADIQKALNQAVLEAEQSSKAVESGHRQAQATANAITVLASSIEESSGAALQIAASSQQQLVGMDQVAGAMENIKQAGQENVEGTRQSEQAARNLHELGQRLKAQVELFRL